MKLKSLFLVIICAGFLFACGGAKKKTTRSVPPIKNENKEVSTYEKDRQANTVEPGKIEKNNEKKNAPVFKNDVERYIYNFAEIAKEEMNLYGIPASITLAQGVLESSSGKGELTLKSNNHFGIKCNGWQGAKVYHDDDALQECFRKYNDPKYSFRDHSLFLSERRRYAALFELDKDDYKSWARGLKKAGYATDPRYPQKLISIIERYKLYEYDDEVLGNGSRKGIAKKESLSPDHTSIRYTVKKGDTLYSIARKYNLTVEEVKEINDLRNNNLAVGQKLYVKAL